VEDLVHVGGASSVASHFRTLVYAEMVARGTGYAEAIAYITMLRMKQPAMRPPTPGLRRVGQKGFGLLAPGDVR
jgi:hypothetical protein